MRRTNGTSRGRPSAPMILTAVCAAFLAAEAARAQAAPVAAAPLTLEEALKEARSANAQLPVARMAVRGAEARERQARGLRYPSFSVDGDLHDGAPHRYASGDALLALFARAPLYDGGALSADADRAAAEVAATQAAYRRDARDVDLAVRVGFGATLRDAATLEFRRRTAERLRSYVSAVEARRAAGQGVGADLLLARQRLAAAEADTAAAARELAGARMELNDLLGRAPDAPLTLAPQPPPGPSPDTAGSPWLGAPDVDAAAGEARAAEAAARAARAARSPRVTLDANAGAQPVLGDSFDAPLNTGRDWGGEVTLSFSLPLWDRSVTAGRIAESDAELQAAQQGETLARRRARLAWSRAAADLDGLYAEYQARERAADTARDAYLEAESLYRGGQGRALDVLDAFDAWIGAGQDRLDVIYAWRAALAQLQRWGES